MVHPPGFSATLARERAQATTPARAPLAIHRSAAAAKLGVAWHYVTGRPEPELAESQQRERPFPGRPSARASSESRGTKHTAKSKLEKRQRGGLGIVRRRDQKAKCGSAKSEGGRSTTQGGQLTVRAYGAFVHTKDSFFRFTRESFDINVNVSLEHKRPWNFQYSRKMMSCFSTCKSSYLCHSRDSTSIRYTNLGRKRRIRKSIRSKKCQVH